MTWGRGGLSRGCRRQPSGDRSPCGRYWRRPAGRRHERRHRRGWGGGAETGPGSASRATGCRHCGETSWACLSDPDSHPDGRKRRWWLWVARAPDATMFVTVAPRAAKVLDALLGADDTATSGVECSAMYAGYGCLDEVRFTHAWCWAQYLDSQLRGTGPAGDCPAPVVFPDRPLLKSSA
ncbi:MAG: IS66 family transposase [Mycobacteriales bacterium]